jgi:hypothetical protein
MPPPVTGKQRAARIPLDYFKHPTFLDWGRGWWALAIAALVALGWAASGWLMSGQGQTYYSRGPVTAVHATWDNDCMACHTAFTPLSGDAYARHFVLDTHAMNQKCEACHAGPPHHANATPELACAACHHDHRGRDASLVRLADSDCTRCHADMKNHMAPGSPKPEDTVTAFAAHPAFKAVQDPIHLKFNHARHLALGMGTEVSDPRFKLADIDEKYRNRYEKSVGKDGLIQLQCAACHELDGGDFGIKREQLAAVPAAAVLPNRAAGAAMLPITYENQCRACHSLRFDRKEDAVVAHRLQPAQVASFLEQYYTGQYIREHGDRFGAFVPRYPLPGKLPAEAADKARKEIEVDAAKAERNIFNPRTAEQFVFGRSTCAECHEYQKRDASQVVPDAILPTGVPDLWYPHAVFDHSAHRAVDCLQCHAPVASEGKSGSETSLTQLGMSLPQVETCQKCHAPRSTVGNVAHGGARSDCTECHRYHNGGEPFAGIGARNRAPSHPGSIEEFLSGSLPGGK